MIDYPIRIADLHVRDKLKEIIDVLNATSESNTKNALSIATLQPPLSINQIQRSLQIGGSNPINITGLQGVLPNMQPTVFYGTHAQRLAAVPQQGTFWWETDRTVLYFGAPSGQSTVWVYAAGIYGSTLANIAADLGTNDIGFIQWVSVQNHLFAWAGTVWEFIDEEGGYIADRISAPTGGGWQVCDGTATDYLQISGATIGATAFTTPDLKTAKVNTFTKSAASYTGTVADASIPTFSGTAGNTGNDSAPQTVQSGTGATVPAEPHTHSFTPAGTISIAGGDPVRNLGVLKYFRR